MLASSLLDQSASDMGVEEGKHGISHFFPQTVHDFGRRDVQVFQKSSKSFPPGWAEWPTFLHLANTFSCAVVCLNRISMLVNIAWGRT